MLNDVIKRSLDLVERSFTGILGTTNENGIPQLKAMIKTESVGLKEFWFCSNTSSKRVNQINANPNVCLYFYDEKTFEGLMLLGKAEVTYDEEMRKKFWHDNMKKYYPLGQSDPDFALIKFIADKGNYYNNLKNIDFKI